jgi:eukaryotic-like serine/threonine-protein kinase
LTPERWSRIKEVFDEASQLTGVERGQFLEITCADDTNLRNEVESLLAAEADAASRYDAPLIQRNHGGMIGQHVGSYRVIRQLGAGGMGDVYLGSRDDGQFRKLAAIKVIQPELLDEQTRRRFENERHTLAALEHPNIVRLLDGGATTDGCPYLIMEYVEGQPVDRFCDEHSLSLRERLELFRTLCGAVHYAHQNLVVHRDLKPANILITSEGVPKLLDFGIAKLLRPEYAAATVGYTRTAAQPMTPEYASPEQILGRPVTTSSDVHSLGVLLYVLTTGVHPFQEPSQSQHVMERAICEVEPKRPSDAAPPALARQLRGDLETIILKAMRKDPRWRYSSAEHLAQDVGRYLDGQTVAARKDTFIYRVQKFTARHKVAVAASAACVALLAGLAVRDHIDRLRAERRFQELRSFANFVIQDFDKAMADGPTPARKALSAKAVAYLDGLASEAGSDPSLKKDLITGYLRVADIQGNLHAANLGEVSAARESAGKAAAIAATFSARDLTDPGIRSAAAHCEEKMGDLIGTEGQREMALTHYGKALETFKGDPIATYRVLAKVAQTQADSGDPAAALASYRGCERAALELQARNPDDPVARNALALAHERIAWFALQAGQPEGAEEQIRAAIAIYDRMTPTPRARRNLAMAYKTMAAVQQRAGKLEDASESSRKSTEISEALAVQDPKNEQFQIDLAQEKVQSIDLLLQNGKQDEARRETAAALARLGPKAHEEKPSLYYLTDYLAIANNTPFRDLVNNADAVALARKGVAMTHGQDSETLDLLAKALERAGNREEAIATEKKALALLPPAQPGKAVMEPRRTLEETLASMTGRK